MIRRFVNLLQQDFDGRLYSLHRLDVSKHLFYPSTADAEAANAKNNGGGGKPYNKAKASRMGTLLRRLPPASTRFQRFPARLGEPWHAAEDMFVLLSPRASEGRILFASTGGHCLLHDVDEGVNSTIPRLRLPMGKQGVQPIAVSVPGAHHESLYVMRSTITSPFKFNHLCGCVPDNARDGSSPDFVVLDFNEPRREWQRLPPPPCVDEPGSSATFVSSTVVDGGRTICVSSENRSRSGERTHGTYCFDTASREWRHAGDWKLPFVGRAEHVSELNTWVGFRPQQPMHLCTADLSAMTTGTASQAAPPTLQHVWEDFNPPPAEKWSKVLNPSYPEYVLRRTKSWTVQEFDLVNLGSGRFCTAKSVLVEGGESVNLHTNHMLDEEEFLVLTGVEVVSGDDGGLRMVRHKSKRYSCNDSDSCSIDWIL